MEIKNNIKKGIAAVSLVAVLSGCADTWNKADNQGGLFTSSTADYIVLKQSGGVITDVYKLNDVIVSSPEHSDGWIFKDQYGNSINIGGDTKAIRIKGKNTDLWNKYKEYHMEFEGGKTYFDTLKNK